VRLSHRTALNPFQSELRMSANADSTFALQLDDDPGGSETARRVFSLSLRGRKLAVTLASSRRSPEELLAEFIELFGDQIGSLH
jgi:hypothetical protein